MTTKKKTVKKQNAPKKSQKTAGHPLKGRDILVKALENEGVTVIFGYPGGASMEIHQGLTLSKKSAWFYPDMNKGDPLPQVDMQGLPVTLEYAWQPLVQGRPT